MNGIHVMADENGVMREFREVRRRAEVGEKIKIIYGDHPKVGKIFTVASIDSDGDANFGGYYYAETEWYFVLEPSDIVHVNGVRYREVKRKAAVGERVVVLRDCGYFYKGGNTAIVKRAFSDGAVSADFSGNAYVHGKGVWHVGNDVGYHVLEPLDSAQSPKSTEPDPLDLIAKLSLKVAELERRLNEKDAVNPSFHGKQPLTRDEIIEMAKRDVVQFTEFVRNRQIGRIEFVVNRDKRTVVALWRSPSGRVQARAVAKCAPNDCYNTHIGKAIAVRRVLNEEIPREYTNTPQPTEAKIGDIVYDARGISKLLVVPDEEVRFGKVLGLSYVNKVRRKPIDDSRELESESVR